MSYVTTSGIQTLLPSTAYSVSLNAPVGGQIWGIGGTVTYPLSGPNISSGSLIIQRILPLTQSAALSNQGNQYPIVTEEALDTLCMEIQQIASQGGTYRGVWASGINYKYSDIVQDGSNGANTGNLYLCTTANLSTVWATDLAAGDWSLAVNTQVILPYLPLTGGTVSGNLSVTGTTALTGSVKVTSTTTLTGNVAIGTTPGGYGLTLLQAGSNQAYFGSTGSNQGTVYIDNQAGGAGSSLNLMNAGVTKWQLYNETTNVLGIFDSTGSKFFLSATTGGSLNLGPAQTTNILQNGAVVVNGTSQVSTAALSVVGAVSGYCLATVTNASSGVGMLFANSSGTANYTAANFTTNAGGTVVGSIVVSSSATAYNTSSDKRLKENVQPVTNSAALIDAMQPVTYDWTYIEGKPSGTGFLAQDLYRVYPDAVSVGDDGAADESGNVSQQWSVDYSKIVPILVSEVKSLRARLESAGIK